MEFKYSPLDNLKREEFHRKDFLQAQLRVKNLAQSDLIKALDELSMVKEENEVRINRLSELSYNGVSQEYKSVYQEAITKYIDISVLSLKISEIYLMVLDIYTYGTYSLLADNEWDWRAFARHFYTMLFEHKKTVNTYLNTIFKILKTEIGSVYDLEMINQTKKAFATFINENSAFAKQIRVNVDAHFDGDLQNHLELICSLSYSNFITLYFEYISKTQEFLKALKPALIQLRRSADASYHALELFGSRSKQ